MGDADQIIGEYKRQLEENSQTIFMLTQRVEQLFGELDKVRKDHSLQSQGQEGLMAIIEKLRNNEQMFESRIDSLSGSKAELEKTVVQKDMELHDTKSDKDRLSNEVDSLKRQLQKAQSSGGQSEKAMKDKLQQQEQEIAEFKAKQKTLLAQFAKLQAERDDFKG